MAFTRGGRSTSEDEERPAKSATSVDAGIGFPACLVMLEAEGDDGDLCLVGSDAYLEMVKSPSKEVLKARTTAMEGKAPGFPILGEHVMGKTVTLHRDPGGAAAFSVWRIKMVALFTNLFLLHCLYGFVIEGADNASGNPFTSASTSVEELAGLLRVFSAAGVGAECNSVDKHEARAAASCDCGDSHGCFSCSGHGKHQVQLCEDLGKLKALYELGADWIGARRAPWLLQRPHKFFSFFTAQVLEKIKGRIVELEAKKKGGPQQRAAMSMSRNRTMGVDPDFGE